MKDGKHLKNNISWCWKQKRGIKIEKLTEEQLMTIRKKLINKIS